MCIQMSRTEALDKNKTYKKAISTHPLTYIETKKTTVNLKVEHGLQDIGEVHLENR